jgi:hypothetical protein
MQEKSWMLSLTNVSIQQYQNGIWWQNSSIRELSPKRGWRRRRAAAAAAAAEMRAAPPPRGGGGGGGGDDGDRARDSDIDGLLGPEESRDAWDGN